MFSLICVNVGIWLFVYVMIYGYVLMGDLLLKELYVLYLEGVLNWMMSVMLEMVDVLYEVICEDVLCGYGVSNLLFECGILVVMVLVCNEM